MNNDNILRAGKLLAYFAKRARRYNHSSRWVDDKTLIRKIRDLAGAGSGSLVLDVGVGTGKIAQAFTAGAKYVFGVDISAEMAIHSRGRADMVLLTPAERLPFKKNVFDVCVCRQGLQFMEPNKVLSEIYRVLKPGGQVILCHLTAYGRGDRSECFLIQKLRNPARKNFFLPGDFQRLLRRRSFGRIESFEYITRESVNRWISNAAIDEKRRRKIKEAYASSSRVFRRLHKIEFKNGDIFDSMKMLIIKAKKRK